MSRGLGDVYKRQDIEIDGSLYTNEKKQKILEVSDFYITFIQGCDEQ